MKQCCLIWKLKHNLLDSLEFKRGSRVVSLCSYLIQVPQSYHNTSQFLLITHFLSSLDIWTNQCCWFFHHHHVLGDLSLAGWTESKECLKFCFVFSIQWRLGSKSPQYLSLHWNICTEPISSQLSRWCRICILNTHKDNAPFVCNTAANLHWKASSSVVMFI